MLSGLGETRGQLINQPIVSRSLYMERIIWVNGVRGKIFAL